jgi:hypothetical protein
MKHKIIVSTRNKGAPLGVCEYNTNGKYIGKVCENMDNLGTVISIITGFKHVACCGNEGNVLFILDKDPHHQWSSPIIYPVHPKYSIYTGCCLTHSGMDIFFTVDRNSNKLISIYLCVYLSIAY